MRALSNALILAAGICAIVTTAQSLDTPPPTEPVSNTSFTNKTIPHFSPLLPPLNPPITPGLAWVYPSSPNDLGARSMSCECFDPGNQCCMPNSTLIAPYCMPTGSTCCGNTFCVEGETCCGDFCCASNTTCNLNIHTSGCCPVGSICQDPVTCYDASSPNCTNTITPAQQCCPHNMPYCRDFAPNGLGCYASSVQGTASTMSGTGWGISAAPTSAILGLGSAQQTASGVKPTTTSTYASIKTVTVSVVPNNSGGLSLEFPPSTRSANGTKDSTTYILEYPSSDIALSSSTSKSLQSDQTSTVMVTGSDVYTTVLATAPSASSTTIASTGGSTSKSPLCFNSNLYAVASCPASNTVASSSAAGSAIPATSPARSQANSMRALPTSAYVLLVIIYILSGLVFLAGLIYGALYLISRARPSNDTFAREFRDALGLPVKKLPIEVVQGSGRRLSSASVLGREISIVRETGRPYKKPVVVDKSSISVVEGSGHWVEGFSEKDPSSMTYTTYGTLHGSAPTTVAIAGIAPSLPVQQPQANETQTKPPPGAAKGNLTLREARAVKQGQAVIARLDARFLKLLERGSTTDGNADGREMVESESTSSLGHVFLGTRDNS
ncbi:hypothetical protein P7C71_g3006, partial [Lecanoromycetidae sp. Uapishka_2]